MDNREYLRSLGFTVGERGRFSKEMLAALASRDGESTEIAKHDEILAEGLDESVIREPVRSPAELHGFDNEGHKIAFILCSDCHQHMMWCGCEGGVLAPSFIVKSENPLVRLAV